MNRESALLISWLQQSEPMIKMDAFGFSDLGGANSWHRSIPSAFRLQDGIGRRIFKGTS
jgi:hypothetical protein